MGFPGGSGIKNPPPSAGDTGLIPGSRRSPEEGNGNPLQYSYPDNPMDREAWQGTVHGVLKESGTIKQQQNSRIVHIKCQQQIRDSHSKACSSSREC